MRLALFSILLSSIYFSFGQILKVNKGSFYSDSSNYYTGVVDATFALNNRNSTAEEQSLYLGISTNADVVYISKRSATVFISSLNYFKIGDGPVLYNGSAHLREIFLRKAKLTPEVFGQIQFDESRNLTRRRLLGGGLRWNILQKRNSLYMGIGTFREQEKWQGETDEVAKNLWKMNSYVSADIRITEKTNFNAIVYFQTGRDSAIDAYRHRATGQIEFKNALTDRFKVKLTAILQLDDKPIIPLNRYIYETFFGVEYSFND